MVISRVFFEFVGAAFFSCFVSFVPCHLSFFCFKMHLRVRYVLFMFAVRGFTKWRFFMPCDLKVELAKIRDPPYQYIYIYTVCNQNAYICNTHI